MLLPLLVGGVPTPLKNMSSSVGMIIPNIWENKKCSKPPTSIEFHSIDDDIHHPGITKRLQTIIKYNI